MIYFDEFYDEIQKHKNEEISVLVLRNSDTLIINVNVPEEGLIGVYPKSLDNYFTYKEINYSFF